MNGPEHYAEAERLMELAEGSDWTTEFTPYRDVAIAAAQVHATLALAAAQAVGTFDPQGQRWVQPGEYGTGVAPRMPTAAELIDGLRHDN